jgi:signal transduction histidine kinase/DNA-binding response OmpR family regulator
VHSTSGKSLIFGQLAVLGYSTIVAIAAPSESEASNVIPRPPKDGPRSPLERLYAATTAISDAIDDEERLLQRIVQELSRLLNARYAAMGILGEDGRLAHFETTGLTGEEEAALWDTPPHGRGILGVLLREGKPLRLDDLTEDPRSVGFPPGHPEMKSFLGVPLVVGEHVLGRLYATEHRDGPFTDEDEMLALGFAGAAAVAIQSARQTAQLVKAERLRATGELAVGIAHDFNNLLATILGRTEVLLGQVRDAEMRGSLEAIRRAARDGAATVARMREYGRPVDATEFRPVDLASIAREAVELTRPRWQSEAQRQGRTIEVETILERDPAPLVLGDPAALREVLVNLIFNAIDALPTGGRISLGAQHVTHSSASLIRGEPVPPIDPAAEPSRDPGVVLWARDTGIGMPSDVRVRIFEPFYTTKGAQGSGLGLAMVRKVVEAHRGTITVESEVGAGTTFRLWFPVLVESRTADATPGTSDVEEVDVPPASIVVVDDQEDVLDTIGMLLRRDGHDVRAFRDPRAAVEAMLTERPDVLITDLGMPGLSGWDVSRITKERWPDLPVILLTGWGRDISAAQLREHGVLMALAKPAETVALRHALIRALQPEEEAPLRILLVDDATAFATVLGVLLRQAGHSVNRVERAKAGIDILTSDEPVDLVILDLNLPDGPSIDVLRAARNRATPPAVCVVSGSAPAAMQHEVPGADLYAEKAYVPERLEQIFAAARRRQGASQ